MTVKSTLEGFLPLSSQKLKSKAGFKNEKNQFEEVFESRK